MQNKYSSNVWELLEELVKAAITGARFKFFGGGVSGSEEKGWR